MGAVPLAETDRTRAELGTLHPGLVPAYDRALPQARAEILTRLLGALHRENLPGVAARSPGSVQLADGRRLTYPAPAATAFAQVAAGLTVTVDDQRRITDPAALVAALGWAAGFHDEIAGSVANLALAYANPPPAAARPLLDAATALATYEQLVADGHPLHPGCRTRTGMSIADLLAYAPEHRPTLRLRRLRVPPDRWYGDGPPVLLAHPWQVDRLRDRYPYLTDAGETGPVRPLMSLRTVAGASAHVKTALNVQMTSAVRTVSPAALHNGPRLSQLLRDVAVGLPLSVLTEYGPGAVRTDDGLPDRQLAHLHRTAPVVGPGETVLPLAALAAADPYDGRPVLLHAATDPYGWWHDLTHLLVPPLLAVLDRGVALEAHGQNTLVVLDRGRPARIIYRDFGGVRVSPARLRAAGFEAPPLDGDLPSDDPVVLRTKLAAAVGTIVGQLVAVLTRAGADPAKLWATAAAAFASAGTADAAAILRSPLPVKATTAMRLAADPLDDIWTHLDNPLSAAA
ncbi:IucA/IucC family protein [Actinoplanes sp. NPDC051859]|uniref:IucA/IucC family protein n=1 Tax=Actinoplanes sp. NPDC051859 TaxID=3363909 RepID=UPI003794DAEB